MAVQYEELHAYTTSIAHWMLKKVNIVKRKTSRLPMRTCAQQKSPHDDSCKGPAVRTT